MEYYDEVVEIKKRNSINSTVIIGESLRKMSNEGAEGAGDVAFMKIEVAN